jgi:predicted acetyltransferase|tara:strand:+ start:101 stop:1081 length:981 start_codon:yes stop_codon:yes gene_type:complete
MSTPALDCHLASSAEKAAAFRNVHEFWGGDSQIDEFVKQRLVSPHHQRATWYVGCVAGTVACSLGAFPFELCLAGSVQRAVFIGCVHTRPENRGQGYTPQLFEFAENAEQQSGTKWSLLFSDIAPGYYERLGYQSSAAPNICIKSNMSVTEGGCFKLRPFDPTQHLQTLSHTYQRHFHGKPFFVHRNDDHWNYLVQQHKNDLWFWLCNDNSEAVGYVLLQSSGTHTILKDFALQDPTTEQLQRCLATLSHYCHEQQINEIVGWFPKLTDSAEQTVQHSPGDADGYYYFARETEITMIKTLALSDDNNTSGDMVINHLDTIRHVDHV